MAHNIAELATKMLELLQPLDSAERLQIIRGSLMMLGETTELGIEHPNRTPANGGAGSSAGDATPAAYFAQKDPKGKMEELAVAAKLREAFQSAEKHTKEELKKVIVEARRNFDDKNFSRDMDNAKAKGLFNKSTGENGVFMLSYKGQQYVDALPDRNLLKTVGVRAKRKPKKSSGGAADKKS